MHLTWKRKPIVFLLIILAAAIVIQPSYAAKQRNGCKTKKCKGNPGGSGGKVRTPKTGNRRNTTTSEDEDDDGTRNVTRHHDFYVHEPTCQAGQFPECVQLIVDEMTRRLENLGCSHLAMWQLTYLITTKTVLQLSETIGLESMENVVRETALFADYWFRAYDGYYDGDIGDADAVPAAWKFVFQTAEAKLVTSVGSSVLGVATHVQRDLPFVLYDLYQAGIPISANDHFAINDIFLQQDDYAVMARERYDPSVPDTDPNSIQTVIGWRDGAWMDYQSLVLAATTEGTENNNDTETWSTVAARIESNAMQTLELLAAIFAATPAQVATRDAFCLEQSQV